MQRLFLTFYAVFFNMQTGLLLLLLGGFWISGTIYCRVSLPDKICWQWRFGIYLTFPSFGRHWRLGHGMLNWSEVLYMFSLGFLVAAF